MKAARLSAGSLGGANREGGSRNAISLSGASRSRMSQGGTTAPKTSGQFELSKGLPFFRVSHLGQLIFWRAERALARRAARGRLAAQARRECRLTREKETNDRASNDCHGWSQNDPDRPYAHALSGKHHKRNFIAFTKACATASYLALASVVIHSRWHQRRRRARVILQE
jgi:hypothetical protein